MLQSLLERAFFVNGAWVKGGVALPNTSSSAGGDHEAAAGSARNISIDRDRTFAALQCSFQGRRNVRKGFSGFGYVFGDMFKKKQDAH